MSRFYVHFAHLSPFLREFSSVFHIPSHLQFQLHRTELFVTFLCSSKQIIDCNLKCTTIYTNVCIIYSAEILYALYMLALNKNQVHFEIKQISHSGLEYEYYFSHNF